MKTLDEVIREVAKRRDLDNDIYHYLKEYRTLQYGYVKAMADLEDNPPLSWDELKQMEGRPVWIELLNNVTVYGMTLRVDSEWWVIGEVRKDDIILATYLEEMELCEDDLGVLWNAYRKERK